MNARKLTANPAPRLLIIDDEEVLLLGYSRALGKQFQVETAPTASDALAMLARGEQFDLVLCDLGLEDMDGADLHRHLRDSGNPLADRMLFCSGGVSSSKMAGFVERMSDRVIYKPVPVPELRNRVREFAASIEE
jgi:CheY-like chemotaxis protein